MTLTEFLLARIAEDEDIARRCVGKVHQFCAGPAHQMSSSSTGGPVSYYFVIGPEHVLAECEAKRRIVEEHSDHYSPDDPAVCDAHDGKYGIEECPTLRALAAIYADHPEYRDEWKRGASE